MATDHPGAQVSRERRVVTPATVARDVAATLARPVHKGPDVVPPYAMPYGADAQAEGVPHTVAVCVPTPRGGATFGVSIYINKVASCTGITDLPSR